MNTLNLQKPRSWFVLGSICLVLSIMFYSCGPALSYFREMIDQSKVTAIDSGFVQTVESQISDSRMYVDKLPRSYLCSSVNTLTYTGAYAHLLSADTDLVGAKNVLASSDSKASKIHAYDLAKTASDEASQARTSADSDLSNLSTAIQTIGDAETRISEASKYISSSNYNQDEAQTTLKDARTALQNAKNSCYGEDLANAISYARSAYNQADTAEASAATPAPTPTPEPEKPTSIPASTEVSTTSDTGSWLHEDEEEDDTDSSEGSDTGSWFSDDDDTGGYGDSGSDTGSWGDGGSDTGAWNEEGSDTGSW